MYSKVNYTIIGLFVILFVTGIILSAFWLGNKGIQENYKLYLLRMHESVTGLSKDSGVKMKGVDIGSVSDISINPKNIEEVDILLKIKNNIPIKEDMKGVVKMYGLTGLSYIEIDGGTNDSKLLTGKDSELPLIPAGTSLINKLEINVDSISRKLVLFLDKSEKVLSDENLKNFSETLAHLNKIASKGIALEDQTIATFKEAQEAIKEFRVVFQKLSKDVTTITKRFDGLSSDLSQELKPTIVDFREMSQSISKMVKNFEKTVDRGDYNMRKIMQPMMIDIRELATQIEEMSTTIEQSPNDILFKSRKPRRGPGE